MILHDDDCYVALKARDTRFDGHFFTCVKSTGIYCRPVCPARTPKRTNCRFVASAAAAQDAGYRPCLRCRPESAPGSARWLGSESIVHRALRIITETGGDEISLETLSRELGISARQLRRMFAQSLGTSPRSIVQSNRLALARQLLTTSQLPMTGIAMAAGFGSVRRFNAAIRNAFDMTPSEFRHRCGAAQTTASGGAPACVHLGYRPPYAWKQLLSYFSVRGIAGLEVVTDAYIRAIRVGDARGHVRIINDAQHHRMQVEFFLDKHTDLTRAVSQVRDLLDLDAAPKAISEHLGRDRHLSDPVTAYPGLRIPGAWSVFETLVRAIVGQQVSVPAARTVLGRLVEAFGEPLALPISADPLPARLFPEPEALAAESLQRFGLNTARAQTINSVAAEFSADPRFIHTAMPVDSVRRRLLGIKGIGPWTAEYVLLRGLRYPDAFPAADLGALKAAGTAQPRELAERAERWRPWRGYALMYLWKSLESDNED
jgi:AraC family transcriptional regulator of adaptative response / DNA-3-methyladenine glycosylase II